ncbi:MFS transporter [Alloscardovia macacae]|uniref:MFS transporter n=1 Tax=Alloscardovia macacae TaxID=1160091 RepID=A0A1Y2SZF7_9BIFI|nr:MFS transporter [Alloscardovia macacae]OTA27395.1 MFS transporter [Alloscardovia macacae]OTA29407.1 MFS transporter [Alloscardovia macacae]
MTKTKFGITLPLTLLAYFLILMDNSIIFTSSVQIGESLNLTASELAWISNAYTLTFGGFLLLSGRLSDALGRKHIFELGLIIFGLSSLIIGVSTNAVVIIAARALQGVGSSIIAPTTLALMMDAYTGQMRTRAISYYGAMAGVGSSVGLLLGGALTSFFSWRAGFLINVPLTILLFALTLRYVRDGAADGETSGSRATSSRANGGIDYVGSVLSVLGFASLLYGLDGQVARGFFLTAGIVLLICFALYERIVFARFRVAPVMPLSLFAHPVRSGAYAVRGLFMMAMLPYWFLLPQALQRTYGFDALQSGFAFLPLTIMTFAAALLLPRLVNRWGNSSVLAAGVLFLLAGLLWAAFSSLDSGYVLAVALPMLVIGGGQALIMAPVTSAGIYKAPDEISGSASGMTNAVHQLGGPLGLSIIMALPGGSADIASALHIMAVFIVVALVVTVAIIIPGYRKTH